MKLNEVRNVNKSKKCHEQCIKIWAMAIMLSCCTFVIYYMHYILHSELVYTHLFYIPIILAAVWWKRKGVSVAIFLATTLIITHLLGENNFPTDDILRGSAFILMGMFTAELVRYRDRAVIEKNMSDAKFRILIDNANVLIQEVKSDGKIQYVNNKWLEILGYSKEEVKDMIVTDILKEDQIEPTMRLLQKIIAGGKVKGFETVLIAKNGKEINVEGNGNGIFENGEFIAAIGVFMDITNRKKMDMVLAHIMKQLESKNKELEDYTYTVSHDLKAPLVTIQGFSELLSSQYGEMLDDKAKHYLDRINQGSENLARLVSDLLELSRAGRMMKDFEYNDFNEIIRMSLDGLEGKIIENNIKIQKPDDFPDIYCDEMRLSQVMSNLIGNAINYMGEQEHPTISIGWSQEENMYEFWVQDNGIGIKDEDMGRIFNIFERAAESSAGGTGIGLSIVEKIIQVHGGDIRVDSVFGNGSKFTFTIPIKGEENEQK